MKCVRLKVQRDGSLRKHWYGYYSEGTKRSEINLNLLWKGCPPESGKWSEPGDEEFEKSRKAASEALERYVEEVRQKGRAEHLTERLIESKTGAKVRYARIAEVGKLWRNRTRGRAVKERYLEVCDAHAARFVAFMAKRRPKAKFLYEVTPDDAAAYVQECQRLLAPATVSDSVRLVSKTMERCLPVGSRNPFADVTFRRHADDAVHRTPFTPEELRKLLDATRDDDFLYPLIVTAACTGMRRGDFCNLRWRDVDLHGGMIRVKTSKTGAHVEIPIFPPLRDVLTARRNKGGEFVFPQAARLMATNPSGLTYRFKVAVARTFDPEPPKAVAPPRPTAELVAAGEKAICEHVPEGPRREQLLTTLKRYCAGESIVKIHEATGWPRGTIGSWLSQIEKMMGARVVRSPEGGSVKDAIARVTRQKCENRKDASIRDWHALRATWVTLALMAGVPVELVKRVTGHATVDVILRHYFRPDREQFKSALLGALPEVLTGGPVKLTAEQELAALAGKVADGTMTDEEKKRLKKLVAGI